MISRLARKQNAHSIVPNLVSDEAALAAVQTRFFNSGDMQPRRIYTLDASQLSSGRP